MSAPPAPRPALSTAPRLEPWDEYNRALVDNVHPAGWVNPTPPGRYDLVVIGAGTGGLVTAAIAVALGARVALVERHLMGGDCLNVGCVPSKAMLAAARAWHAAREASRRFGGPPVAGDGDFAAVMRRMRRIRAEISPHDGAARFRDLGVDVHLGEGRFCARDALVVGGARLRFRRAVIATGARPAVPDLPGLDEAGYLTNETVFSLTRRPERLLVLGAGPIGCELAQAFARFGTRVTLLDSARRVLTADDEAAAALVQRAIERDGVGFLGGARATRVEARGDGAARTVALHFEHAGRRGSVAGDHLLVATGRAPNVESLGLEAAGVRAGAGGVEVDDRLCTSNRRVYAVGDVCSRLQFTHAADAQARLVVRNALFYGRGRVSDLVVPRCTYTSPALAHVGIDPAEAARRDDVETLTVPLDQTDRARLDGEDAGQLRLHLRAGTDRILGATLLAEDAGELISQVTQALVAGNRLGVLGDTIFPYPTRAEVLRKAADQWRRRKLTPLARRVFEAYFRLTR